MYEFSLFLSQIRLPFEPQTCIYNFLLGKSIKIFRSLHLQYGTPDCFSSPLTSQWQMSFPFFNTFPVFSDIPVLVLQLPLATANCRAQSGLQPVLSDCYHLEPLHLNLNSLSVGSFPTPVLNLSLWVHTHTSKKMWTYSLCGHFHTLRIMLLKKKIQVTSVIDVVILQSSTSLGGGLRTGEADIWCPRSCKHQQIMSSVTAGCPSRALFRHVYPRNQRGHAVWWHLNAEGCFREPFRESSKV